jgi:hypothetical protein
VTSRCANGPASPLADRAGYVPRVPPLRTSRCRDDLAPLAANGTSDPGLDWYLWATERRPLPAYVRPQYGACARGAR